MQGYRDGLVVPFVDLATEGVDTERFEDRFTGSSSLRASPTAEDRAEGPASSPSSTETAPENLGAEQAAEGPAASGEESPDSPAFEETVLEKLETIESRLDDESDAESLTARVLSGNGDTVLQLLDDTDLEAGEIVDSQVKIRAESRPDGEPESRNHREA